MNLETTAAQSGASLENGDCLAQPDFHRRYESRPDLRKCQLIEGIVFMASPVPDKHGREHSDWHYWARQYADGKPIDVRIDPTLMILDFDNEFQPDVLMRQTGERPDACRVDGNYLRGAPSLIIEIAASSASIDLGAKKHAYQRNGIQEYIVRRIHDDATDWFELVDGVYQPIPPGLNGQRESRIFPGLILDRG